MVDWSSLGNARSLSLPDRLSIRLEQLILDGSLQPGDKLPSEMELTEQLGVSRVSIRQALHELEIRGLIDRRPGRGTVVLSPTEARSAAGGAIGGVLSTGARPDIEHILELRSIIEPPIAGLTSIRATARDIAQLEGLVQAQRSPRSREHYAELDQAFHQAIAQYTHNPLLAMLNQQIASLIAPSRSVSLQTKARRDSSTAAHQRILDAIRAKDAEAAEREARAHLVAVREQIVMAEHTLAAAGEDHPA